MQIALFVIPFLVLVGWVIGQPLSLDFQARGRARPARSGHDTIPLRVHAGV